MAYKFQFGAARLSGSTTFEEAATFEDAVAAASLSASAAVSGHSLDIETSANIAGNIDSAGDLTVGTITMSGFAVDADGDTALKSLAVDDGSTIGPDSVTDLLTLAGAGHITVKDGAYDFDIAAHDGTNGLKLGGTLVTSTAAELNYVDVSSVGTVEASKAVVVDSNKDAVGFRNLSASAEVAAFSLDLEGAANIAGNIDSAGDLTVGSITMSEFTVDSSGNTDVDGTLNVEGVPTFQAGAVFSAGITTANAIAGATTISGSGLISGHQLDIETSANIAGDIDSAGDLTAASITMTGVVSGSGFFDMVKDKLRVDGVAVTTTAAELNLLDGVTATTAELNYVDVTAGAAAASKALVLDGNKDISGLRNLTAEGTLHASGIISSSAQLQGGAVAVDGAVTAGSLSGSGAVSGFSLDIENGSNIGGATVLATAKVSDLTSGRVVLAGTSGELEDSGNLLFNGSVVTLVGAISASSVIHNAGNLTTEGNFSATGSISSTGATIAGAVQFSGITADTALDVAADGLFFNDGEDGTVKNVSVGSFMTDIAGAGLTVISNQLAVQGNAVSSVVSGSTLSEGYNFIDAASTGSHGMDLASSPSVGDVVHVKAGSGVSSTNFVEIKVGNFGSHFIDGTEKAVRIESPFGAVSLVYVKENQWRIV